MTIGLLPCIPTISSNPLQGGKPETTRLRPTGRSVKTRTRIRGQPASFGPLEATKSAGTGPSSGRLEEAPVPAPPAAFLRTLIQQRETVALRSVVASREIQDAQSESANARLFLMTLVIGALARSAPRLCFPLRAALAVLSAARSRPRRWRPRVIPGHCSAWTPRPSRVSPSPRRPAPTQQ